jgi:phosphatidate cytidylyltransferase
VSELAKRVATGVLLGPAIFLLFWYLPTRFFFFFMVIVAAAAVREVVVMAGLTRRWFAVCLALLPFVPLYFKSLEGFLGMMVLSAIIGVAGMLLSADDGREPLSRAILVAVSAVALSQVFLIIPLYSLFRLREAAPAWPAVLLLSIWASDTCAYALGKTFGRRPLVPSVSPKKTYEGLLGAVLGSMALVALTRGLTGLGVWEALGLGALLGMLGQLGDIFESASKRSFSIKDSSALIPGHGGVLDRIDSFLFSAPFVYFYCTVSAVRP